MKCCHDKCEQEATLEVFWPGQTKIMCAVDGLRAVNLGAHMGFNVTLRPLENPQQETRNGQETR